MVRFLDWWVTEPFSLLRSLLQQAWLCLSQPGTASPTGPGSGRRGRTRKDRSGGCCRRDVLGTGAVAEAAVVEASRSPEPALVPRSELWESRLQLGGGRCPPSPCESAGLF